MALALVAPHRDHGMLPILIYLEANLDGDVATATLARRAGLSASAFHRAFRAATGETVKRHTLRLRLERAAFRLRLEESTVLRVATDCGFRSHATFTRAFGRRFGTTPSAYRAATHALPGPPPASRAAADEPTFDGFELAPTRVRELRRLHVAFLRLTGDYRGVDPRTWSELREWAERTGRPCGGLAVGIGRDAPGVAPDERLRFDACVEVPGPFVEPDGVGYQLTPGGLHAVTSFAGSFARLPVAYEEVFARLGTLQGYRPLGLPVIEIYGPGGPGDEPFARVEICVPVQLA